MMLLSCFAGDGLAAIRVDIANPLFYLILIKVPAALINCGLFTAACPSGVVGSSFPS